MTTYRSLCGHYYFGFRFVRAADHIDIYCLRRPPLNGQDSDPNKTHLFSSGKVCFVAGREPRTKARAEELARDFAEYYLRYRRTGRAES